MSATGRVDTRNVDRIPVAQGETVVWTGRPHWRARLRDLSLQVLIPVIVGLVGLMIVFGDVRAAIGLVAIATLFWGGRVGHDLWRLSHTHYALTERHLYTSWGRFPPRTSAVRLTALPSLELADRERPYPSIVFRSPDDRSPSVPTWLAPRRHVLLDSIADAPVVLERIESLRAGAAATPSATVHPRPGIGSGRRLDSLYLIAFGVVFLAVAAFGLASTGRGATSGGWVVSLVLFGAFAVGGLGLLGWQVLRGRAERELARSGQTVLGVVTEIVEVADPEAPTTWEVRYGYEVMGRPYTGRCGGFSFEEAHRAGLGETILLRVDVRHPERSMWATS